MGKVRLTVFASGFGSTLEYLLKYEKREKPKWRVIGVVSDNPSARALKVAEDYGIQHALISRREYLTAGDFDKAILRAVHAQRPDIIFLLGYLKMIGSDLTQEFAGRMFNSHPSLLPKHGGKGMFGRAVHDSVVRAGDFESGVTIHEVNDRYDDGRTLLQQRVPINPAWSVEELEEKIKAIEKELIVVFLNNYCSRRGGPA